MTAWRLVAWPVDDQDPIAKRNAKEECGSDGVESIGEAGERVYAQYEKFSC